MAHVATHPLDLLEHQFNQVAAFLAEGNAPQLQAASEELRTLGAELARLLASPAPQTNAPQRPLPADVRQRVTRLAQGLQVLRDQLSRQAAANLQALQVVVPTQPKSTYSGGSSVYGSVGQQAGVKGYLAA